MVAKEQASNRRLKQDRVEELKKEEERSQRNKLQIED